MSTLATVLQRTWIEHLAQLSEGTRERLATTGLTVFVVAAYGRAMLPGMGFSGDAAKFQYLGHVLGTGHPPGEPIYTMLLAGFDRALPLGTPALRANVMSAVFGTVAVLLLYRLLRRLDLRRTVAMATAGSLAVMPTLWSQAIVAEVYTLVAAVLVGLLYLLVRWHQDGGRGWLYAAVALYGASIGLHTMVVLFVPAVLVMIWLTDRRALIDPRAVGAALGGLALGLASYLYIYWRTLDPATPYLEVAIADVQSFVEVITGSQFHGWMFAFGLADVITVRVPAFLRLASREFLLLLPIAVYGVVRRADWSSPLHLAVILVAAADIAFALNYAVPDLPVFFLPAYLAMAVWAAYGLDELVTQLSRVRFRPSLDPVLHTAPVLVLATPLLFGLVNYPVTAQRGNVHQELWATSVVEAVADGGVIFAGDYQRSQELWYVTIGQGAYEQRDIHVLSYRSTLADFDAWLAGGQLTIPEQRIPVPPDRPAYVVAEADAQALEGAGYALEPIDAHGHAIWRVHDAVDLHLWSILVDDHRASQP
ncbi:MAG TPA: DUF2723 domain-containing protein [Nitriliruptorales bacterium]